jgi:hypothetical protein
MHSETRPDLHSTVLNLAGSLRLQGNHDAAVEVLQEHVDLLRGEVEDGDGRQVRPLLYRGRTLTDQGSLDAASTESFDL